MSEKRQRTATGVQQLMWAHYGDIHHKHNKSHLEHSNNSIEYLDKTKISGYELIEGHEHWGAKAILAAKQRKTRTRFSKGGFH